MTFYEIHRFVKSQGFFLRRKIDPKWFPNRSIDAEGAKNASLSLLECSWSSLGDILSDLEGSWRLPGAIWAMLEADMAKTIQKQCRNNYRPGGMRRPALDGKPSITIISINYHHRFQELVQHARLPCGGGSQFATQKPPRCVRVQRFLGTHLFLQSGPGSQKLLFWGP